MKKRRDMNISYLKILTPWQSLMNSVFLILTAASPTFGVSGAPRQQWQFVRAHSKGHSVWESSLELECASPSSHTTVTLWFNNATADNVSFCQRNSGHYAFINYQMQMSDSSYCICVWMWYEISMLNVTVLIWLLLWIQKYSIIPSHFWFVANVDPRDPINSWLCRHWIKGIIIFTAATWFYWENPTPLQLIYWKWTKRVEWLSSLLSSCFLIMWTENVVL